MDNGKLIIKKNEIWTNDLENGKLIMNPTILNLLFIRPSAKFTFWARKTMTFRHPVGHQLGTALQSSTPSIEEAGHRDCFVSCVIFCQACYLGHQLGTVYTFIHTCCIYCLYLTIYLEMYYHPQCVRYHAHRTI